MNTTIVPQDVDDAIADLTGLLKGRLTAHARDRLEYVMCNIFSHGTPAQKAQLLHLGVLTGTYHEDKPLKIRFQRQLEQHFHKSDPSLKSRIRGRLHDMEASVAAGPAWQQELRAAKNWLAKLLRRA